MTPGRPRTQHTARGALVALAALLSLAMIASAALAQPSAPIGSMAPELRARRLGIGSSSALPSVRAPRSRAGPARASTPPGPLEAEGEVTLASLRGSVVLLVFVASWCGACHRLEPRLAELERTRRERGLRVLTLSHEGRDRLRAHVARNPSALELLQCTGRSAVQYGADALPTLALVDRTGVLRGWWQGASDEVRADVEREVDATLAR